MSALIKRLRENLGSFQAVSAVKQTAMATGNAVRQGGESVLVGGLLGVAHVELATGLDVKKVPLDAALGVLGLGAGVAFAHEEFARDMQNIGSAALTTFAFRKSFELAAKKKAERGGGLPGGHIAGEFDVVNYGSEQEDDAILEAARQLKRSA